MKKRVLPRTRCGPGSDSRRPKVSAVHCDWPFCTLTALFRAWFPFLRPTNYKRHSTTARCTRVSEILALVAVLLSFNRSCIHAHSSLSSKKFSLKATTAARVLTTVHRQLLEYGKSSFAVKGSNISGNAGIVVQK